MLIDRRELAPPSQRASTDFFCLLLFAGLGLGLLIFGVYLLISGGSSRLLVPYDSSGNGCGINHPNHPFIYFPSPQYDSLWVTTCVSQCPSSSSSVVACVPNSVVTSCQPNNSVNNTKAFHVYATYPYKGKICMPVNPGVAAVVDPATHRWLLEELFGSVFEDWTLYLLMVPVILVMVLFTVALIRLLAGYVIYIFYTLVLASLVGFGVFMLIPDPPGHPFILKQSNVVAAIIAGMCITLAIAAFLIFFYYRERIYLSVNYINQANQFFKENFRLLLVPFGLTLAMMLLVEFWVWLNLAFFSLNRPSGQPQHLPFQYYRLTAIGVLSLLLNLFYFFWGTLFLIHSASHLVSGSVVNWAFQREQSLLLVVKNYFTSHIGSVCAGSFLTTLFGAFKIELDEADCAQVERSEQNQCIDCLKRCYGCVCCCCLAFFFRLFHHAAYSYQNLTGLSYCQSSTEVYELIRSEKEKWTLVANLYMILDGFISLAVSIGAILLANLFIQVMPAYQSTPNRLMVFLAVAVLAYSMSQFFPAIYAEAIKSIFVIRQFHNSLLPDPNALPLAMDRKPEQEGRAEGQIQTPNREDKGAILRQSHKDVAKSRSSPKN